MMAGAMMVFSSVSVVTSSLLLRRWVRPTHSVMPDDLAALERPRPLWAIVGLAVSDAWDAVRERVRWGSAHRGYSQVNMDERV